MQPLQPKRIWPWILTVVAVLFVVKSPEAAADLVSTAAGWLSIAAESAGTFVESL